MSCIRSFLIAAGCLVTGACGGDGNNLASPPPPSPPPPPPAQSMGGFWTGELTFDAARSAELFVGLVTANDAMVFSIANDMRAITLALER